jgi:hypothetical protein
MCRVFLDLHVDSFPSVERVSSPWMSNTAIQREGLPLVLAIASGSVPGVVFSCHKCRWKLIEENNTCAGTCTKLKVYEHTFNKQNIKMKRMKTECWTGVFCDAHINDHRRKVI